ncbi:hypothetical protein C8F01DRAFT_1136448 [Mycena amicta]|nr:hypothetical protein C8F01DRAFT_1136448 [Mycena amicta]
MLAIIYFCAAHVSALDDLISVSSRCDWDDLRLPRIIDHRPRRSSILTTFQVTNADEAFRGVERVRRRPFPVYGNGRRVLNG